MIEFCLSFRLAGDTAEFGRYGDVYCSNVKSSNFESTELGKSPRNVLCFGTCLDFDQLVSFYTYMGWLKVWSVLDRLGRRVAYYNSKVLHLKLSRNAEPKYSE